MKIPNHFMTVMLVVWTQWISFSAAQNYTFTDEQKRNANRNLSIGYIVYHGFEILDIFGPLEVIHSLSWYYNMTLSIIASDVGPVHNRAPPFLNSQNSVVDTARMTDIQLIATHSFETAPKLDLIIVPGGVGEQSLFQKNDRRIEQFIASRFNATDYVLSVCAGATLLARAGVLDGRRATTNKVNWATYAKYGSNVTWVPSARWVQDGKVWTSSGVSAGTDMIVAFMRHIYGDPKVNDVVNDIEYLAHVNASWDPFSVVDKVPGANMSMPLVECTGPLESYPE